ncbi:peptide ABC transporter substrate-binding protein [Paenibacillus sp. R14(2021)]|uniref:peptide ABC transporter substrate-binding protein n=1 Tax=Paenibacillus sp. R14(2021) TaxID=2859228 RepID=UPI001C613E0F|nr:peptide ABC transporter substrate-binding protein [Paenibacillus sp. R14(2021)]
MKTAKKWLVGLLAFGAVNLLGVSVSAKGDAQRFVMGTFSVPDLLDPSEAADSTSISVMNGLYEGLVRMNESGQVVPGMAKSWKVSSDGTTYTFVLRSNARWSNKQPVKASDFEYAWKNSLAPSASKGLDYDLFVIANAEAYHAGKVKDAAKVGVKALNDYTLQVKLKEPAAYFPRMLTLPIFDPIYAPTAKANAHWAEKLETMVTNGPFKLKAWNGQGILLAKNNDYYDAGSIRFSEVQFLPSAGLSLESRYLKGQTDWINGSAWNVSNASDMQILEKDSYHLPSRSTYYYQVNMKKKPFTNVNIRKALAMAISRKDLGHGKPATGFIPYGLPGAKKDYRDEVADGYFAEDREAAKKLLAKGLQEEGLKKLPEITIISIAGVHEEIGQRIIEQWKTNLGIQAKIEVQEWGVLLKNREHLNFDIARAGWGADYADPATFLEYFASWSPNNDSGWKSIAYDAILKQAKKTNDIAARTKLYAKAEKLLMDNMVIIPLYYYVTDIIHKTNLKHVYLDNFDSVSFTRGYFE